VERIAGADLSAARPSARRPRVRRRTGLRSAIAQAMPVLPAPAQDRDVGERSRVVLALNSGSSSLKFGLYRVGSQRTARIVLGEAEALGGPQALIHAQDAQGAALLHEPAPGCGHADAVRRIAQLLGERALPAPQCIGHRIVHGGPELRRPCRIDAQVRATLRAAAVFAPAHMPDALAVIALAQAHFPGVAQVACFDTSFHATMPDIARVLPIPAALRAAGLQRYGFHGLSCESIVRQLGAGLPSRLVIAHLGNGASITAVADGRSVDTSMGLTPTGGLIMGTRSGDLDPGVLVYLVREGRLDAAGLEALVDRRSGLLGISGLSGDMRVLHREAGRDPAAGLAIDMFCYSAGKQIAAMSAVLQGIELLVFTGGIGQNDAQVRARICERLQPVGVRIDAARNAAGAEAIGAAGARCQVRILPSEEDEQIARHAWDLC
jgi:acetate kinase